MKSMLEEIINQSIILLQSCKKITEQKDILLLQKLEKIAGSKIFLPEITLPNKKLNLIAINQYRQSLLNTLICIKHASDYEKNIFELEHCRYNGKIVKFKINNQQVYKILSSPLNSVNFAKLFDLTKRKGVFSLSFSYHLPNVTTNTSAKHMTRKWTRDHMGMLPLIEDNYPEELWAGIEKQAEIYSSDTEVVAFENVFKNPDDAKLNKGIAHVFVQNDDGSIIRDSHWKMNQRIESHGELLRYMSFYCRQRILNKEKISDKIIECIIRFMHYLYIQGLSPQSCGPWEEIPFSNGINWDDVSIIRAFENVIELIETIKNDEILWDKFSSFENSICQKFKLLNLIQNTKYLKNYIKESLKEVRKNYCNEFRGITKRIDASSVILAAEGIMLCAKNSFISNIKKHLKILQKFEKNLVHPFGAWRYNKFMLITNNKVVSSFDSYLNLNYDNLCDCNGGIYIGKQNKISYLNNEGSDASDLEQFTKRSLEGFEKASAQWALPISYAALAFCKLSAILLQHWQKNNSLSKEENILLEKCMNSSAEYIKRSYGNITGCKSNGDYFYKADGQPIKPWRKPESYQAVSKTFGNKNFVFVPGVNDHLGWEVAKCYEASKLFLENLKIYEKLSLNNNGF